MRQTYLVSLKRFTRHHERPRLSVASILIPPLKLHSLYQPLSSVRHLCTEIVGSGTHDSSCYFQLFFDEACYLFECGDGTKRLCTELGITDAKLCHIFLTSLSALSVGGLLSFRLKLADAGKKPLFISAPHGSSRLFTARSQRSILRLIRTICSSQFWNMSVPLCTQSCCARVVTDK